MDTDIKEFFTNASCKFCESKEVFITGGIRDKQTLEKFEADEKTAMLCADCGKTTIIEAIKNTSH